MAYVLLRRLGTLLRPDNYVTYPGNSQSYNRFTYAMNNPLSYVDPDGNNPIVIGMIIGAAVAASSYTYQVASSNAGMSNWNWGDFTMQTLTGGVNGGVSGGLSFGIGNIFGSTGSFWNELGRSGAHGIRSYLTSGGDYSAAISGALGSAAGSVSENLGGLFDTKVGGSLFAATVGGISAGLSGGDMLNGFGNALIVHLLNQGLHKSYNPSPRQEPPGFPGAGKGSYNNESKRWRWKLPNGDIAEWDKKKGEIEVYDKSGKNHKGGFDPQTGKQRSPAKPDRTTPKIEGVQEAINTFNRFKQIMNRPATPSPVPLPVPSIIPWIDFAEVPLFRNSSNTNNQY